MNTKMIERLLSLNREFYASFAQAFSNTRPASDPTVTSILPYIPERARVLDVGCGNGRLALLLDQSRPGCVYVGVDVVPELLKQARSWTKGAQQTEVMLQTADITQPGWTKALPVERFDRVVALAVLHHIPTFGLRAQVLRDIASVLEPSGQLILSTWQFLENERMRRKIVPWARIGLAAEELDPDDYLLDWKRGGHGLRYCHLVDRDEMEQLAAASGFEVRTTFRAGGREGDLSLYAVLCRLPG
jgi:SAM-dependent methyltransferase